jgi:hypothetical protein
MVGAAGYILPAERGAAPAAVAARTRATVLRLARLLLWLAASVGVALQSPLSAQPGGSSAPDTVSQRPGQSQPGRGYLRLPSRPYSLPGRELLNRGVWQGYTNVGRDPYETFTVSTKAYEVYDRLGEHVMRGYPLTTWEESRSASPGVARSTITRSEAYWQWFDCLYLFRESQNGRNVGLAVGHKLRSALTPLIYQAPRYEGTRLDVDSKRHGVSLLLTRGQPNRFSQFSSANETSPIVQFGGRWYSRLGQTATAGLTFYNQHIADVLSSRGNLIEGT